MTRKLAAILLVALGALCLSSAAAQAQFGLSNFDVTFNEGDGSSAVVAGSHPYSMTTTVFFNKRSDPHYGFVPDGEAKDVILQQIEGLIANPTAVPKCANVDFLTIIPGKGANCPESSMVGSAEVWLFQAFPDLGSSPSYSPPIYSLVPPPGAAIRLGFIVTNVPITIDVGLIHSYPYNGLALATHIPQPVPFNGSRITLWGTPGAAAHHPPGTAGQFSTVPFLTLPRACLGPKETTYAADSWQNPGTLRSDGLPDLADPAWVRGAVLNHDASTPAAPQGFSACDSLEFGPVAKGQPTTGVAESPSGLNFDLTVDNKGLSEEAGRSKSDLRKTVVTLPEGVTTNPAVAAGLTACSLAQYESETVNSDPGTGCPESSKVGSVEITSPLIEQKIEGSIYVAKQGDNPFNNLLTIYMVAKNPELGIIIQSAGKVDPDSRTGQLVTTFDDLPQLPFSHFHLHFREGPRAPLITPSTCGTFRTEAVLNPWSGGPAVQSPSTFDVSEAPNGRRCASSVGELPNNPGFVAGTENATSGEFAPFVLKLDREDDSQQFSRISTTLPSGLLGRLAGIPYCSDESIRQAESRSGLGQGAQEIANPSCPAASQVGTSTVASGAGSEPLYTSGKIYLAGPYKGAPLSLEIITPAIAGPFDLGVVAVRTALNVDPTSTRITAVSDPIPTILHGLPLDVRSVVVQMSRPNFTLNPTNCEPKAITGSATSTLGSVATLSQYFQSSNCGRLDFRPKLKLSLRGKTKRAGHPALKAVLTYPNHGAYANIARAQVALPHAEFLDQGNLNKVCTQPELKAASCPKTSIYGKVKAWTPLLEKPLKGNVYLGVGFGYKLPALVTELNGQIRVLLVGRVDTAKTKGIRNTFETVPDAPVSRFVIELKGGKKYGLIENSEDLCSKPQRANARFIAQNGLISQQRPTIDVRCKKKRATKKGHGHR